MIKDFFRLSLSMLILFVTTLLCSSTKTFTLLILGDSLTEGFGVREEEAFPALLEDLFKQNDFSIKVINGGSSGSTSAAGVSKLKWYSKAKPDAVIIALGSNDGLRGVPLEATQRNLDQVVTFALEKKWKVILAGLQIPPNYGKDYTEGFKKIYPTLAEKHKLPMMPFLLKDVAGEADKNLPDGIHPNPAGHKIIADNLFKFLSPLILTSSKIKNH